MTLLDKVRYLQELFEKKEELAEATKANNAAIEEVKEAVAQQMIDDDCPRITFGGYNFSLAYPRAGSSLCREKRRSPGTL